MSLIYHLAGENLELAKAEVQGFLRSQDISENVKRRQRLAFTESHPDYLERLALVHEVSEILTESEELDMDYRPEGSFKVEVKFTDTEIDKKNVEEELGQKIKTEDNKVDLENPEETVNVYILNGVYYITKSVLEDNRGLFSQRENQKRPFSSPVSLDPVLARTLVNLSEAPVGGTLLDPFCGTGGILIEAGLCGIKPAGLDIQKEMVEGAAQNLEEYGILNHDIRLGEIQNIDDIFDEKFDAIVTDLPYGKSSKLEGEPIEEFLEAAPALTEGKIVFMSDQPEIKDLEPKFEVYVHQSLTRYIYMP